MEDGGLAPFQLNEAPCVAMLGGLILCRVDQWHPSQEPSVSMNLIHDINTISLSWHAMEAAMGSIPAFGSFSLGPQVKKHQHAILLCSASCL